MVGNTEVYFSTKLVVGQIESNSIGVVWLPSGNRPHRNF
jgi:hypothetical protein